MNLPSLDVLYQIGMFNGKAFAAGWIEGVQRFKANGAPAIVPGSHFTPGTIEFAASQAAVAFCIGRSG